MFHVKQLVVEISERNKEKTWVLAGSVEEAQKFYYRFVQFDKTTKFTTLTKKEAQTINIYGDNKKFIETLATRVSRMANTETPTYLLSQGGEL
ncbi:hypothetical protein PI27_gp041 [Listeria phage WIL-1]|uniref:hypothetical protein n=1 Tax=Listeria phage WIL-1 TaxID=1541821 RepID=UPI00248B20D1|nr:hypothetical protein PI27_gp041 [Listeria phage WIL-1]